MQIFAGGAGGARLVPQLIGHEQQVIRNYRSPGNAERIGMLGAGPITLVQPPARVWRRVAGSS
jgi:hypothetical protein